MSRLWVLITWNWLWSVSSWCVLLNLSHICAKLRVVYLKMCYAPLHGVWTWRTPRSRNRVLEANSYSVSQKIAVLSRTGVFISVCANSRHFFFYWNYFIWMCAVNFMNLNQWITLFVSKDISLDSVYAALEWLCGLTVVLAIYCSDSHRISPHFSVSYRWLPVIVLTFRLFEFERVRSEKSAERTVVTDMLIAIKSACLSI
jgi:hypothetical protein